MDFKSVMKYAFGLTYRGWFRKTMLVIALLALGLRLAWLSQVWHVTLEASTDQYGYVNEGRAWADLHFSTGVLRTPVYPAIIAVFTQLKQTTGLNMPLRLQMGMLQSLLACIMVYVTGTLTKRLTRSPPVGVIAALMLACWPNQIYGASVVMTEMVGTPLFIFALACAFWYKPSEMKRWQVVGAASFAALATLTRPSFAPALLVLGLVLALRSTGWRVKLRRGMLYGLAGLIVLAPWMMAVAYKEGHPTLSLGSAGGFNICLGNNPLASGKWETPAVNRYCHWPKSGPGEVAQASRQQAFAIQWVLNHPGEQLRLLKWRTIWTFYMDGYWLGWYPIWDNYQGPGQEPVWREIAQRYWRYVCWVSFTGVAFALLRRHRLTFWLLAVAASSLIGPLVSIGDPRFHDQLIPMIAGFAAYGLVSAVNLLYHVLEFRYRQEWRWRQARADWFAGLYTRASD